MNITVIGPTYPYKGGISHFTTVLVKHLRQVHNVNFISWKRQYPTFLYPVDLKDTKSKKPLEVEVRYILDFFNPFSWIFGVFEIKKFKSDLLLLTWASPVQAPIYFFICALVKLFTKTKIIYICHNVLPHENTFYDKPLILLTFFLADSFIVHSEQDKKVLEGLVKNKKIIKGFLPTFDFFPQKSYDIKEIKKELGLSKQVLLFFGYIRPYKGLKYLLEAMPELKKKFPDLSLLVVGEFWSKDKDDYLHLVNKLNIDKDVLFISNYVPNEELGKYFAVSDVVVLPYISATQSASVQTAYAFDKPVISTTVGGLKDVVKDGITGYTIKSSDNKDIITKIEKFYTSWKKTAEFEKFKNKFSWSNYIDLINQI